MLPLVFARSSREHVSLPRIHCVVRGFISEIENEEQEDLDGFGSLW